MKPEITILIATANAENFIGRTMESLLSQSFVNFEIVVVINCVSDQTVSILKKFDDARIRLFETNICQLAFNLNYGLMMARGDYIARIDSDDVAAYDRLKIQLNVINSNDFDVVGSNVNYIDENDKAIGRKSYPKNNYEIRKKILYSNPISHPSVMYKKNTILGVGGYMNGLVSEDYDLWIRLMRDKSVKFHNIQIELTSYRIHKAQSMGNRLAYAEVSGYFVRELIYQKSLRFLGGFFVSLVKAIFK
ncbi:glycosyltransferase [Oceanospirillaceae bacterium]|nr:glycosyltransferase [Oceanospirillaceae bacterium]